MAPLNTQQNINPNTPLFGNSDNSINDPLSISNSDHPRMVLNQTLFNGGNFIGWSRSIKMALGAKLKLGFIDGTCAKPTVNDVNYQRWIRCDYMATCWSNGPLIYQLKRELSHISQGSLSIASYFNKLKRCWDEMKNLNGLPTCTCGKMRDCSYGILDKFLEIDSRSKLMRFLMKLSKKECKSGGSNRSEFKRVCTGCNQEGDLVKQCFERIGYPDWYKGKKGKKDTRMATQITLDEHVIEDIPFDIGFENGITMGQNVMFDQKLVAVVCSEVMKMFKNKWVAEGGTVNANQESSSMHYAGIFSYFTFDFALLCYPGMDVILDWISDTGASVHMSHNLHLFICVKTLKHPIVVHLPDGRTKTITLGQCVLAATYLINRMPMKVIGWKTPYEKLHGKVPSYDHLRVIGCLCYAAVTVLHRDKLDPRGIKCVLLGYPRNSKGYTLYDLDTQQVFHSRDVVFEEHIFPFKTPVASSTKKVELDALEKNQTWELTSLPIGHKAISLKWVYKIKYKASGKVDRHKARPVIRGFDQKEGTDYKHTFSLVAKLATVRVLISLDTNKGWHLHQLDINNAFLHGFLEEDIYMQPPAGYTTASPGQVCKLKKSLYGLKQASRQWNHELSKFLQS
nr:retrovirus-related Pol polyprotein from transposon TNT 1-94 [Tanacetum cinerariifolium]